MPLRPRIRPLVYTLLAAPLVLAGCTEEARPWFLGGTLGAPGATAVAPTSQPAGSAGNSGAFTEVMIQQRTFVEGKGVVTAAYNAGDSTRTARKIDFNSDGRIDPVVAYRQGVQGVVQILLSYGPEGDVKYQSLTLDGGENQWDELADIAVGDIDGDGALDIVVATSEGVVYLRHPDGDDRTHILSEWGAESGELEIIEGTSNSLSAEELDGILAATLGATFDRTNYVVTVEEGYTAVEIGDYNNDGSNDIASARQLDISLEPKPDFELEPIHISEGSVQILINPGGARDGQVWTGVAIGLHERHAIFDRQGSSDLRAVDLDGDGDLDLVTAARDDNNVQVAWFENPAGGNAIDPALPWPQYRIGSLLGASRIDVAELTGDGRLDVIGVSPVQQQAVLFVQPEEGPARGYDWFNATIVNFETYEPRSVVAIDIDGDSRLELAVGGTNGAVRYFEPASTPIDPWRGTIVWTFEQGGDVGLLGYGDLEGDGDIDLVAVASSADNVNVNRVSWLRSGLAR